MKRLFNNWLIVAFLFFSNSLLSAQESPIKPWLGDWRGTLEIYNTKGLAQTVVMELNVATLTDSTWQWQIVYGEGDTRQERNYELVETDDPGHYIIDEKNSIELYLSLINNGLYSVFQVNQNNLLVYYELEGDQLIFRTLSVNTATERKSGGGDNIPEVLSWKTGVSQRAVLTKNK